MSQSLQAEDFGSTTLSLDAPAIPLQHTRDMPPLHIAIYLTWGAGMPPASVSFLIV